jgi:hypothetical protein
MRAYLPIATNLPLENIRDFAPTTLVLLTGDIPTMWNTSELISAFYNALKREQFTPAKDYVVMTGRTVYVALMMLAVERYMTRHYPDDIGYTALVFDGSQGKYREMRFSNVAPV